MSWAPLLPDLLDLGAQVAQFIAQERRQFARGDVEYKGASDPVSYVDRQAEEMLVKALAKLAPEAGFVTEEDTHDSERKDLSWIIDPLDGTTNFVHAVPHYCVSVALVQGETPLLGLIYDVERKEAYYAARGEGAFCDKQRLQVSPVTRLEEALLSTGFPYPGDPQTENVLEVFGHVVRHSHGVRRQGSAALDLAYVAAGRYEAYFEGSINPWDVAAGTLIVREAGGHVTDFAGSEECLFSGHIVAGGALHPQMLKLIQQKWRSS